MQTVYLVGGIERFGNKWSTKCNNIRDIFKLIECQRQGFRQYLIDAAEADVGFEIRRGEEFLESPEELLLNGLGKEDIIITEVPSGSKGGVKKILAAIAIVAVVGLTGGFGAAGWATAAGGGLSFAGSAVLGLATNLALAGISELLAPGPETDPGQNEGYLFNGPVNTTQQGLPVPVCYGELLIGGKPISVHYQGTPFQTTGFINYSAGNEGVARNGASITENLFTENSSYNYKY